jgi:hypothetical protein
MSVPSFTLSQIGLLLAPPLQLGTTYLAYRWLAAWLGPERGYLAGFLFYWICWCFLRSHCLSRTPLSSNP